MEIESVRTITEIIDAETGELLHIDDQFFRQNEAYLFLLRRRLYEYAYLKIGQPKYLCAVCRQPVVLLGKKTRRGQIVYFAHYKDSDDCPIKTRGKELSEDELNDIRYKGGESDYHVEIKHQIFCALQTSHICHNSFSHIQEEERIASKLDFRSWAIPDVYAECGDLKINFEVQLSTLFLSTIIERDVFYRFHGIFIIWIFAPGAINNDTISRKDIIWTNNGNLFIYDQEAREITEQTGELTLLCRWYELVDNNADEVRLVAGKYLTLSDLTFDSKTNTVYYVDVTNDIEKRHPNFKKERTEMEQMELEALDEFRFLLDGCTPTKEEVVEGLKSGLYKPRWIKKGNYWGYAKYGYTIIPFIYNHTEDFVDGFAIVRRNRKYGVVNMYGEEIVEPKYKTYKVLNNYIEFSDDMGLSIFILKGTPYIFETTTNISRQISNIDNSIPNNRINQDEIVELLEQNSKALHNKGLEHERGILKSYYNRIHHYSGVYRTAPDIPNAYRYYLLSANQGYAPSQNILGRYYEEGKGVEQDLIEAVKWYRKAAEQNLASAQWNLALCYNAGRGVEQDYEQAFQWFQKSAEQGHMRSQNMLGQYYENGRGVEQDLKEAVEWYKKAAEQNFVSAQWNLALCYNAGRGVEQDYEQAFQWFQKSAEQGHMRSQNMLGQYYENGRGVEQDLKEAVEWYKKAAEQNFVSAQWNLALCYDKGKGVEQDYEQAFRWFQKAAEQGHKQSQYVLGYYYELGQYVHIDYEKAKIWYQKSAEQGYEKAKSRLNELE